jgi:hypothetical protein
MGISRPADVSDECGLRYYPGDDLSAPYKDEPDQPRADIPFACRRASDFGRGFFLTFVAEVVFCIYREGKAMFGRKSIVASILLGAYFALAYANSLCLVMPILGSGEPAVQQAKGAHRDFPKPGWLPKRHLPLVKLPAIDTAVTTNAPTSLSEIDATRIFVMLDVPLRCKAQPRQSGPRSPPIA